MDTFGKILNKKYAQKSVLGRQVQAALVVEFANEKIKEFWGKKGTEQAQALSLKNNMLTINCANSIMAQELRFKQYPIMEMTNKKFGDKTVKRIKIVQKGVEKNSTPL